MRGRRERDGVCKGKSGVGRYEKFRRDGFVERAFPSFAVATARERNERKRSFFGGVFLLPRPATKTAIKSLMKIRRKPTGVHVCRRVRSYRSDRPRNRHCASCPPGRSSNSATRLRINVLIEIRKVSRACASARIVKVPFVSYALHVFRIVQNITRKIVTRHLDGLTRITFFRPALSVLCRF